MKPLLDLVARHKRGDAVGIYSLCSAHPFVIESAMHEAQAGGTPLLLETTSNQVNQDGGYTGMTPAGFQEFLREIAGRVGFAPEQVWLGGDHLGPNPWRAGTAAAAMARADELVNQYVAAGFRKIHLDCSMACADDPTPLPERTIAERAARLCAVAERAWSMAGGEAPVYVVGTEVPVPGGADEDLHELAVTTPGAVETTIDTHRTAFDAAGLTAAWARVIALVVQPGVEFDHHKVIDYRPEKARALSACIARNPQLVYEAHSTDYQTPESLRALVRDHFAILKVGPAATFALRESLWALDAMARELRGNDSRVGLREVATAVMRADPRHWSGYYRNANTLELDLSYSLSDRVRYYWPHPDVQRACSQLLADLARKPIPLTLISQYLPAQYLAVRAGRLAPTADSLLRDGIASSLRPYIQACGG